MSLRVAAITAAKYLAATAPKSAPVHHGARSPLLHFLFSFGLLGVFLVSIVDSSFVPLPLPGITDIMIIVLAAQHQSWFLLILLATAGSGLGGWFSYQVGQSGGMAFIEKRIPARIFKRGVRVDGESRHSVGGIARYLATAYAAESLRTGSRST